ncbi:MAG: 2-oxo acid dehydrogenase subunit E2 [Steroidobacteraceae bacterium]|nr:2-oxo acid dehydrogenase subunit E2 [Steroidobacteraceae bacterium]
MTRYVFKMPDLGEGTVEAEVVAWHAKVGDVVEEDQVIAEVMTEKAAVEVPSPVSGRIVSLTGAPGDMVPVGAELIVFDIDATDDELTEPASAAAAPAPGDAGASVAAAEQGDSAPAAVGTPASSGSARTSQGGAKRQGRVMASPATRRRAREAGIDLATVEGSGPSGRITRQDFESALGGATSPKAAAAPARAAGPARRTGTEEVKVIGVRRVIATRMTDAKRNIPHFAYVEEVDVTELESLRQHLNGRLPAGAPTLTFLPFIGAALTRVLVDYPQCNAHYDAERNVLTRHHGVHLGVATQTPDGLKVPVVRHAEALTLWDLAGEIRRVSEAARAGKASREELSGSTITITSLGRLGGIVSTPIINAPEMAIIGVNKAIDRPMVANGVITVRRMMNLSSSFDHRYVDGYDAAAVIQALKDLLEHPATIFIPA